MKRYIGVLHEEHMSGLKVIKEGVDDINQRLDVIESDVEIIKNDLKQKVDRY